MAVHLNARLKTRFIPLLFILALLVSLGATLLHASADGVSPSAADDELSDVSRDEIQAVMSEGTDPGRLNRSPGFSTILAAPQPIERPNAVDLDALNDEDLPSPRYLDFSDELPAQPQEVSPEQK